MRLRRNCLWRGLATPRRQSGASSRRHRSFRPVLCSASTLPRIDPRRGRSARRSPSSRRPALSHMRGPVLDERPAIPTRSASRAGRCPSTARAVARAACHWGPSPCSGSRSNPDRSSCRSAIGRAPAGETPPIAPEPGTRRKSGVPYPATAIRGSAVSRPPAGY